jgi:hypothetical protein
MHYETASFSIHFKGLKYYRGLAIILQFPSNTNVTVPTYI